jgi:hypothetical protein
VGKHFLWRVDGKKKDVAIYDDMLRFGMHHLIMVTPKARITFKSREDIIDYILDKETTLPSQ